MSDEIPEFQNFEIIRIAGSLVKPFNVYEYIPPECRESRLVEAIQHIDECKTILKNLPVKHEEIT